MRYVTIIATLLLIGCSKSPEDKLQHYISDQNKRYVDAAIEELEAHFPREMIAAYTFNSTHADFRKNDDGQTIGLVYVLFEKNGTRQRKQIDENTFSVIFDSLQINFEMFDSYKRIQFMISEDGKATSKDAYVVHHPKSKYCRTKRCTYACP